MSKKILKVEYILDGDEMSDEEYENQKEKEFFITEDMIIDLMKESITLKRGQYICEDNLFITKI
jgi:hypothetical protein